MCNDKDVDGSRHLLAAETMKREVKAGVDFLKRLAVERGRLYAVKAEEFAEKLQTLLCEKYRGHWDPKCPTKGQAFRCIRVNEVTTYDDLLLKACEQSGIAPRQLGFPPEVTVWIDPLVVSARSSEKGAPFIVAHFEDEEEGEERLKGEQDDSSSDSRNPETSDYHSATSSECGNLSDAEEEAKECEVGEKARVAMVKSQVEAGPGETYMIAMVPRVHDRTVRKYRDRLNKPKIARILHPAGQQYDYPPPSAWPQHRGISPVYFTTVYSPAPPPPSTFRYYIAPQLLPMAPPAFIVPQLPLQPMAAERGGVW